MKPLLTIAIPTFKNMRQLVDCLHTLTRYCEFPYRIVVVNNGPAEDKSGVRFEDTLRHWIKFPDLKIVQPTENLGWIKGINRAFEAECDTEFFCMANDDLVFIPYHRTFLRQLCGYFRFPEVGAVGPATNYVMGSQSIFDHRGAAAFSTTLLIGFLMIVRSQLFSEIGGLDEGLPGGDDLDLSILIRKKGYKLIVDRTAYVHHIGSQTGPKVEAWWNTHEHVEATDNFLIHKHGVREWYDTKCSKIDIFQPITQDSDREGDVIREWVADLQTGIDVGCGGNKTVPTAVGIDRTPKGEMGHAGGQTGVESSADKIGEAEALPLEAESQDYVIARHVFEHLIDPLAALEEWKRVLRPGGVLAIACPNQDVCNSMILDWTHVHAYTPRSLERMLKVAGFEVHEAEAIRPGFTFAIKAVKPELRAAREEFKVLNFEMGGVPTHG